MSDNRSDAELVELVRGTGGKAAYGELVRRYQGHAYGLAYSLLGDWHEAEDIAQEAFIRAYVNLHSLELPSRFAAWLRRITFGTCVDWMRKFHPQLYRSMGELRDTDELADIPDTNPKTPLAQLQAKEMSEIVLSAIDELPPKYRIPLTMFHLDGLSYEKVAEFLEIPVGTVSSLISRARSKIKPALEAYAKEVMPMVREALDEHKLPAGFAGKVLDGISRVNGLGSWCPKIKCYGVVAERLGVNVSPDYLAGVSGIAFRLQIHSSGFCPSAPDPGLGFLNDAMAREALRMPNGSRRGINPHRHRRAAGVSRTCRAARSSGFAGRYCCPITRIGSKDGEHGNCARVSVRFRSVRGLDGCSPGRRAV